jgi:aminoglycoside 6'-N-acetyltransferase
VLIDFRPLTRADFPLLSEWLHTPHVSRWWEPMSVQRLEAEHGPGIDGTERTRAFVARLDGHDIGFARSYVLDDHPQRQAIVGVAGAIGIDYLIGDPALVGRGIGTRLVGEFVDAVVRVEHPTATRVIADPEVANRASWRTLERNGFVPVKVLGGRPAPELLMVLDLTAARPQTGGGRRR